MELKLKGSDFAAEAATKVKTEDNSGKDNSDKDKAQTGEAKPKPPDVDAERRALMPKTTEAKLDAIVGLPPASSRIKGS